jgi:hypothetical protein
LKLSLKDNPEKMREIYNTSKKQLACAGKLLLGLKANEEALCNFALYHLAVFIKDMLHFVCFRFSIKYTDDDSIETLFKKTSQHLPAYILDMEEDICYWYNHVQFEKENVKTVDEACQIGSKIEDYFNEYILVYATEMQTSMNKITLFSVNIKPLKKF